MNEDHYLSQKFYRKKKVDEIEKKIKLLGSNSKLKVYTYLNIQTIGSILFFFWGLLVRHIGFILGPLFAFLYYKMISYLLLDKKIKIRQKKLEEEALVFFEILTLALETGRNLQEALLVTVDSCTGQLVDDFKETLQEVHYGKSLTEALRDMNDTIPSDTIRNIIVSLTDANLYGSSIIDSLYTQLDYLRDKRREEVKEEISKIPVKISIISVFFFIPLILMIILGPVLLSYIGS